METSCNDNNASSGPTASLPSTKPPAEKSESSSITYSPLRAISYHESLEDYRPGGLHPVLIEDSLGESNRFKVLRKLGHGSFGTVWMCWDNKMERLRAVKVMHAETIKEDYEKEIKLLHLLSDGGDQVSVEDAYENHLAVPLEHFWQEGPNGRHPCIVMPVLGPNVQIAKFLGNVDFLKDICSQVASGLAFLHSKGLAHGDLHPGNILLQTNINDLKLEDARPLFKQFSYECLYAEGQDGPGPYAPKHIYEPMNWTEVDWKYLKKDIAIIDFGALFKTSNPPNCQTIDESLMAPEQFFGSNPSQSSDLWALGCSLTHILGSRNPFKESKTDVRWSPLRRWEDALGPLPQPYRAQWIGYRRSDMKRKYEELDESEPLGWRPGELQSVKKRRLDVKGTEDVIFLFLAKPTPLRVLSASEGRDETEFSQDIKADTEKYEYWTLPGEELELAVSLIRSVIKYKPEDRTPAKDLLAHPWLAKRLPSEITAPREPDQPPQRQGRPG